MDKKLGLAGARALVLVDDLDRCDPQKAVEMLRAINLLLDFKGFIVCLGIDARVISRAVEKHYDGLLGEAGISGYEYLDKIVQIPFRIPSPPPSDVALFVAKLMRDPLPRLEVEPESSVRSEPEERIVSGDKPKSVNSSAPEESTSVTVKVSAWPEGRKLPRHGRAFTYDEYRAFQRLSALLLPNPRHLKRLVNIYRLVRSLANYGQDDGVLKNHEATILWIAICAQWPYTAHLMIREYADACQQIEAGALVLPAENPLAYLLSRVQETCDLDRKLFMDKNPARLHQFIEANKTPVGWEELGRIQKYTMSFNPAIESEWVSKG